MAAFTGQTLESCAFALEYNGKQYSHIVLNFKPTTKSIFFR